MIDVIDLYDRALEKWGMEAQMNVAIEEMSELTKELCKAIRGQGSIPNISEEIADVKIMLEQLVNMFGCEQAVSSWTDRKLNRLNDRLLDD